MFQTNIAKTKTVHRVDWKTLTATKLQANIITLFFRNMKNDFNIKVKYVV